MTTAMTTEAIGRRTRLGLEDQPGRGVLGLGEHDREQDEDADRADVDDDLGRADERRAHEHVDAGQRAEAHDHGQAAADDVLHRHDQQAGPEHDRRQDPEQRVLPVLAEEHEHQRGDAEHGAHDRQPEQDRDDAMHDYSAWAPGAPGPRAATAPWS